MSKRRKSAKDLLKERIKGTRKAHDYIIDDAVVDKNEHKAVDEKVNTDKKVSDDVKVNVDTIANDDISIDKKANVSRNINANNQENKDININVNVDANELEKVSKNVTNAVNDSVNTNVTKSVNHDIKVNEITNLHKNVGENKNDQANIDANDGTIIHENNDVVVIRKRRRVRSQPTRFIDQHTPATFYIRNDLLKRFNDLVGDERGAKTRMINEAIEEYLATFVDEDEE